MFSKESEDTARSAYDLITRTDGKRGSRAVATRGTYAQGVGLFIVVVAGWLRLMVFKFSRASRFSFVGNHTRHAGRPSLQVQSSPIPRIHKAPDA